MSASVLPESVSVPHGGSEYLIIENEEKVSVLPLL